jgi:hypothetical protein
MTPQTIFAMTTRDAGLDHYLIACFDPGDQVSHFAYHTGNIVAENMWQRYLYAWQSTPHPDIQVIEGASADLDQYFVGFDRGLGHLAILQYLWSTMLIKSNGFHSFEILAGC